MGGAVRGSEYGAGTEGEVLSGVPGRDEGKENLSLSLSLSLLPLSLPLSLSLPLPLSLSISLSPSLSLSSGSCPHRLARVMY